MQHPNKSRSQAQTHREASSLNIPRTKNPNLLGFALGGWGGMGNENTFAPAPLPSPPLPFPLHCPNDNQNYHHLQSPKNLSLPQKTSTSGQCPLSTWINELTFQDLPRAPPPHPQKPFPLQLLRQPKQKQNQLAPLRPEILQYFLCYDALILKQQVLTDKIIKECDKGEFRVWGVGGREEGQRISRISTPKNIYRSS